MTRHFILAGVGADLIDPEAKLTYTNEYVFGIDREIMANTTFGVRYVYRDMPQVLEDIANCPMVAYELAQTQSICGNVEYILTNPSSKFPLRREQSSSVPGSMIRSTSTTHSSSRSTAAARPGRD